MKCGGLWKRMIFYITQNVNIHIAIKNDYKNTLTINKLYDILETEALR